jgi:cell cycle checkpoint protein
VVTVPDDDSDGDGNVVAAEDPTQAPERPKSTGKLKSIKNGKAAGTTSKKPEIPKAKVKDTPKTTGRTIHSFFNTATQRQTSSSQASVKPTTEEHEVETIHDDTDEERPQRRATSNAPPPGSSATALAMRKRKPDRGPSEECDRGLLPPPSQKFRKVSSGDKLPSFSIANDDKRPWAEQFAPVDMTELAVHKRKVADVRNWLEMAYRGSRQRVLVLKGAAGTGKTMTVQLLAKELGIDLTEWHGFNVTDSTIDGVYSADTRFEEFVARAGKMKGLELSSSEQSASGNPTSVPSEAEHRSGDRRQALLIEDFPSTFSKTSTTLQAFRTTIAQFVSSPVARGVLPVPIIMVISETLLSTNTAAADSFTAHRLLGPELITNPHINTIEFNPVAPTYLIKALEGIVLKEARKSGRRRTPGPEVLKRLAETGDIRSAVSSLEFLCLRGDSGDTWSSRIQFTKPKGPKSHPALTVAEMEALKLITNRESSLGIFHSVGKVVYNKRVDRSRLSHGDELPPWLSHHQRSKIPETDTDSLIDELGTDTSTFVAALHENYALSCASNSADATVESMSSCMESLSDSDLLSLDRFSFGTRAFSGSATDTLRQDEMCFQVAVRGILFNLPHPVHRSQATHGNRGDAHRMFYPASLRIWKKREEIETKLDAVISRLAAGAGNPASNHIPLGATVESWNPSSRALGSDDSEVPRAPSGELRKQMLMERLPYLAQIASAPKRARAWQPIRDHIAAITNFDDDDAAAVLRDPDVELADDDDDTNVVPEGERWTTDRPEELVGRKAKKAPHGPHTAFGRVSHAVEAQVETLVLEDDDIED